MQTDEHGIPFPDISEKAQAYISSKMPDPSAIPLSQLRNTAACAVCGEDLGDGGVWKQAPDGVNYLTHPNCKFKSA